MSMPFNATHAAALVRVDDALREAGQARLVAVARRARRRVAAERRNTSH